MLNATVISNGIEGIEKTFQSNTRIKYSWVEITKDFDLDLTGSDILIIPNGSDSLAMFKVKDKIKQFLDQGNALFCFDGWFTDYIPGNKWIMDNQHKTIDIRYHIKNDPNKLFEGIDIDKFIFSNGISGWWACGYIQTKDEYNVILADTWNRPIVVLDETSTKGLIFLTASGPLADRIYGTDEPTDSSWDEVGKLYQNLINLIAARNKKKINNFSINI